MEERTKLLRSYLSAEGAEHFDDIVLMRMLGATPNIKSIGYMYEDLGLHAVENGLDSEALIKRVNEISDYFIELRGESSHAIITAIKLMTRGLDKLVSEPVNVVIDFLKNARLDYEKMNGEWMANIKKFGYNVLSDKESMLVFDYSSTVAAMMQTAYEHGKSMTIYVPESRALDGGKPFVVDAIKFGHKPHFFPDAAMELFVKKADVCFTGAETFFPDGCVANTVGSQLLGILCQVHSKPFYIPTALLKVNMKSLDGRPKKQLGRDLRKFIASHWDAELADKTEFMCPDLDIVDSKYITGFITEEGVIPPYAMFRVSKDYMKKIEG